MAYSKYRSTNADCFEETEPGVNDTGSRKLNFTEAQDAIWLSVQTGAPAGGKSGGITWTTPATVEVQINDVNLIMKNNSLVETETSSIKPIVGIGNWCWLECVGLKNK